MATFETSAVGAGANGFWGAVFDGRYMYLVPSDYDSIAVRFDARNPPAMPKLPGWNGSFF